MFNSSLVRLKEKRETSKIRWKEFFQVFNIFFLSNNDFSNVDRRPDSQQCFYERRRFQFVYHRFFSGAAVSFSVRKGNVFLVKFSFSFRIGRRVPLAVLILISGLSSISLAVAFLGSGNQWLEMILSMMVRICLRVCYCLLTLYTAELYPTSIRFERRSVFTIEKELCFLGSFFQRDRLGFGVEQRNLGENSSRNDRFRKFFSSLCAFETGKFRFVLVFGRSNFDFIYLWRFSLLNLLFDLSVARNPSLRSSGFVERFTIDESNEQRQPDHSNISLSHDRREHRLLSTSSWTNRRDDNDNRTQRSPFTESTNDARNESSWRSKSPRLNNKSMLLCLGSRHHRTVPSRLSTTYR